jgi:hypothetical protein
MAQSHKKHEALDQD